MNCLRLLLFVPPSLPTLLPLEPCYVQLNPSFLQQKPSSSSVLFHSPFSSVSVLFFFSLSLAVVAFASFHVPLK